MNFVKNILLFSLLALSHNLLIGQQDLYVTLEHDGETRNFLLYLPTSYSEVGQAMPLVINYHGFGSTSFQQRGYSDINRVAEEEGFITCHPSGIDNAWNVDWDFGSTADDIGFTGAIIDTLLTDYNINPGRVYACGMSNGGFFSYNLACNLFDRIAAVASVTGSFTPNMVGNCNPSRKVPVMEIHGTDDPVVPYDGLAGSAAPIEDVIDFWLDHNECDAAFETIEIADINTNDGSTVTLNYYTDCGEDTEVLFAIVNGGGHTWPLSPVILGDTNLDYDASQEIWNFFSKHKIEAISDNKNLHLENIALYPNPTTDKIFIDDNIDSYEVYSIQGKRLLKGSEPWIDLSTLKEGSYFLRLEANEEYSLHRIIKI